MPKTVDDPLIAGSLLLGWVSDVCITIFLGLPSKTASIRDKSALVRAFNKVMCVRPLPPLLR